MPSTTITLRPPHPFELRLCLFGHGWIDLAPHDYDESRQSFSTALRLGSHVVDAELRPAARGSLELRLVSRRAPSGRRAFPTPAQCLRDDAFYRDTVRAGYRAAAARELAAHFVAGTLDDAMLLSAGSGAELNARLLSLRGFGPYAAGQAMRLFGHYEELALDSWCRARLAELDGSKRPPGDRTVARRYSRFRPFQGLALWLDLTAEWHGEPT